MEFCPLSTTLHFIRYEPARDRRFHEGKNTHTSDSQKKCSDSIQKQNDPQRLASFNADWSFPQVRSFYRLLTLAWGSVTVAQVVLHTVLAFTLPISLMLMLGPILSFAAIIPAAHWSIHYVRKNKRLFDQLRRERDAAIAKTF